MGEPDRKTAEEKAREITRIHPLTGDRVALDDTAGWVIRTIEPPADPSERTRWERENGARILAQAEQDYPNDEEYAYVAGQRLAPWPHTPDTFTAERIAGALIAARAQGRAERRQIEDRESRSAHVANMDAAVVR